MPPLICTSSFLHFLGHVPPHVPHVPILLDSFHTHWCKSRDQTPMHPVTTSSKEAWQTGHMLPLLAENAREERKTRHEQRESEKAAVYSLPPSPTASFLLRIFSPIVCPLPRFFHYSSLLLLFALPSKIRFSSICKYGKKGKKSIPSWSLTPLAPGNCPKK